jgi:hypothetical protein
MPIIVSVPCVNLHFLQPWQCWTDAFACTICHSKYHSMTYDLAYTPENSTERQFFPEVCTSCTRDLVDRDPEMITQEYWNNHTTLYRQLSEYGLLDRKWLEKHGIDITQMFAPPPELVLAEIDKYVKDGKIREIVMSYLRDEV